MNEKVRIAASFTQHLISTLWKSKECGSNLEALEYGFMDFFLVIDLFKEKSPPHLYEVYIAAGAASQCY